MQKVVFLCQHEELPSTRIRVFNLLPVLREKGNYVDVFIYPSKLLDKLSFFKKLKHYDVVILQKKLVTFMDAFILRKFAKRLFFDFDDAIYLNDDTKGQFESKTRYQRFRNIVKIVDGVIAGNPYLAKRAFEFNKNVFVLPSAVFTNVPIKMNFRKEGEDLIIGWVGGGSNLHHLDILKEPLKELAKKIPFQLRVISNRNYFLDGVNIKNIPWHINTQNIEISRFDCGLMPLPENPWTEGKCSYKALQYMAAAVVPVATRFGFNCHVIGDKKTGFLFSNADEFISAIDFIYKNPKKAFQMGQMARERIIKEFSVEVIGEKLTRIITGKHF